MTSTFRSVQCLAPWLSGMVDPGLVQSELTALNAELSTNAKPALAAFSVHITTLVVRSGASCMQASDATPVSNAGSGFVFWYKKIQSASFSSCNTAP